MSVANEKVERRSFENREDLWHVVGGVTETWKSQCNATGKQLTSTCRIMCELDFAYIGQLLVKIGFAGGYLLSGEGSAGRGSGGPEAVAGRAVDGGGCGGGCHISEKYKIPYSV